jgi:ParB-like chromosome segregation protein Spo0J
MVRKGRLSGNNPFASESKGTLSFDEADRALYGELEKVDTGRMPVRPVSIFEIYPDPTQPRRAMPSAVRQQWNEQPNSLADLFVEWIRLVGEERGSNFDLETYLTENPVNEPLSEVELKIGPFEAGLLPIVQLAASILRDGLVNPITVVQKGNGFLLETGERRWLAFHLLYAYTQDSQWSKISARVMPEFNRFRQAFENTQRANLNMVARARQYALLVMEAWNEKDHHFTPIEDFENEQEFYAQVADIKAPDGANKRIFEACGVTSRASLSYYKTILALPHELWVRADDESLSYARIQALLNAFNNAKTQSPKRRPAFAIKMEGLMATIQKAKRQDRIRLIDEAISELERLKQNLE